MSYLALRFDIDADAAEVWADALMSSGALSVDIADARAGTPAETPLYNEPGSAVTTAWPVSRLTVLFSAATNLAAALAAFAEGVERHGSDLLDGDPILVTVVGAGFTSGSVLLRWIRRD